MQCANQHDDQSLFLGSVVYNLLQLDTNMYISGEVNVVCNSSTSSASVRAILC